MQNNDSPKNYFQQAISPTAEYFKKASAYKYFSEESDSVELNIELDTEE